MIMKTIFRLLVGALGLVALFGGVLSIATGLGGFAAAMGQPFASPSEAGFVVADSEFRYFAGVWFGVGLALLYSLGNPFQRATLLRAALIAVFIGGLGRVIAISQLGMPSIVLGPTVVELVLPPLLWVIHQKAYLK